jgi:hypothetical protein
LLPAISAAVASTLVAFAGIWTTFNGDRGAKSKPMPTAASGLRLPDDRAEYGGRTDHPKAMPAMRRRDIWGCASWAT